MSKTDLAGVCMRCARGGAHKRSRADELELTQSVAGRMGVSAEGVGTLHELWLEYGYGEDVESALGKDAAAVFTVEDATTALRRRHFDGLAAKKPERRLRAAEWWLKAANKSVSRRGEALLCDPGVVSELAAACSRERDPRVREALVGALALVVARYFPDRRVATKLVEFADDRHSGVRFFAVQGVGGLLGRSDDRRLLQTLVDRLRDGARGVREASARELAAAVADRRLDLANVRPLLGDVEKALAQAGADASPELRQLCADLQLGSAGEAG